MSKSERTVTVRLHIPWDAGASERLYRACRTQDACWNLALDFLVRHPTEPLQKSRRLGVKGVYGRWQEWREAHEWARKVPQALWRGGVFRAREQVQGWEASNEEHARVLLRALEQDKEIPRRVQRRNADPHRLYRRRKDRDRKLGKYLPGDGRYQAHRRPYPACPRGREGAGARTSARRLQTPKLHHRRAHNRGPGLAVQAAHEGTGAGV